MTRPAELLRRLLYLIRRDHYTAELEEEMRLHVQLRAERLEGAGLDHGAARYAAKRRFGNITHVQERSRDMWGMHWFEQSVSDLRFAVRRLRNRPGFSLSTIAVAALGIGATTAVFSAIDAAMLRPLPFTRPGELVSLTDVYIPFDEGGRRRTSTSPRILHILDVSAMPELFASVAAYAPGGMNLEDPTQPRRVRVGVVTANFFSTLGVRPSRGRAFAPEEGKPGGPKSVILSDALWSSQYGRGDVVGKSIMLHGSRYEIIGVMPASFSFPSESDLWIPMSVPNTSETFAAFRGYLPSRVIGRLARGVSVEGASSRLLARWELSLGKAEPGSTAQEYLDELHTAGAVVPFQQDMVSTRRKAFLILMGATMLLLLIAFANVANLLLSDGASRRREVALREVLGANRGRVVRLLLIESTLLSISGAIVGVVLAPVALGLMRALMPAELAGTAEIRVDLRVLTFATALALVTGLVFGLWPALGTSRVDPAEAIKSGGGHGSTSGSLASTRRILVIAELALTVMLLVGAGLMLKSFHRVMTQELGMQPGHTGTLEMTFARTASAQATVTGSAAHRMQLVRTMLDRLQSDPQLTAVGVVNDLPLRGAGGIGISIEAVGVPKPPKMLFPRYLIANGGYFRAMGIPLLRGRVFDATDDSVGQRVAIISQSMARAYWPGMDALNRTFLFGGGDKRETYQVIGIVGDVREGKLDGDPTMQMYFSMDERGLSDLALVARSSLPPARLLARLTTAVREMSPSQAVYNVRMMDDVVSKSVAPRRTNTMLIAAFGVLALILSAFGVYAVVSYSVARRAREFGIRSALGANRGNILSLVSADMARVVALGLVLGLTGAWGLSRVLASMLYEVDTHDLTTFIVVPALLLIPAAIATLVPATRAMRVSPTEVMRAE